MIEDNEIEKRWNNKLHMLYENELWLNEQAKKGRILKSFDRASACFTETHPEYISYKIIVLNQKKAKNQIKVIEHQGFTFVGSCNEYHIFYINEKYGHIRPSLNENMAEFARNWLNKQMVNSFAWSLIAIAPIMITIIFVRDNIIQAFVELPTVFDILLGFAVITSIVEGIHEYRAVSRTKKYFLEQEEYRSVWRTKKSIAKWACLITIGILAFVFLFQRFYLKPKQYSISEVQKTMPIVLVQDIEQDTGRSERIAEFQRTVNKDYHAEINHTLLASNQYRAWQTISGSYMMTDYYEVAIESLAQPLARELPLNDITDTKKEELKRVDIEGLDAVYTWKDGSCVKVSACKGNRVMYIWNLGDMQIKDILREIAEVL